MAEKSPFSKLVQVSVVVKDIDMAIGHYQSLGIGPFRWISLDALTEKMQYGKPVDLNLKVAIAKVGSVEIELIQPVEGAPLQQEFLDTKGEGINHIGFLVDDIDAEEANLAKKGLKVVQRVRRQVGGSSYFDTREVGGVLFELYQSSDK